MTLLGSFLAVNSCPAYWNNNVRDCLDAQASRAYARKALTEPFKITRSERFTLKPKLRELTMAVHKICRF
jgi:hypothetical protein